MGSRTQWLTAYLDIGLCAPFAKVYSQIHMAQQRIMDMEACVSAELSTWGVQPAHPGGDLTVHLIDKDGLS